MRKLSWGTKGAKAENAVVEAVKKAYIRTRRVAIDDGKGAGKEDRKRLDVGKFLGFFPMISIPPG